MKIILSAFLFVLVSLTARGQGYDSFEAFYYTPSYIFKNDVNLRSYPSLDSSIVATVHTGTKVYNLANEGGLKLYGLDGHWTKVMYNDQICFVWSRLLSKGVFKDRIYPNLLILFGCGRKNELSEFKALYYGKVVSELEVAGNARAIDDFKVTDNVGIKGIVKMFTMRHYASSCGGLATTNRVVWDGQKLHHFFMEWGIPDGQYLNYVKLILPNDFKGQAGVIHYFEVEGRLEDEPYSDDKPYDPRSRPVFDAKKFIHKKMTWNGEALVEI